MPTYSATPRAGSWPDVIIDRLRVDVIAGVDNGATLRFRRTVENIQGDSLRHIDYHGSQVAAIAFDHPEKAFAISPSTKTPASRP